MNTNLPPPPFRPLHLLTKYAGHFDRLPSARIIMPIRVADGADQETIDTNR
jgi:hypothetical protein